MAMPVFGDEPPPAAKPTPSIFELTEKAKEALVSEAPVPLYRSAKGKQKVLIGKEVLRITLRPDGSFRLVRIDVLFTDQRDARGMKIYSVVSSVEPAECSAERVSGGGVNANYRIVCGGSPELVLAGKDILLDSRGREAKTLDGRSQAIYIPYSDDLARPEIIEAGKLYIHGQISRAAEELRRDKVYSRAIPGKLVADIFSEEILFRLSLIEHIDHAEFEEKGAEYSAAKVLTQFGLNRGDTFEYAVSWTGALCLMQIMPSTYSDKKDKKGRVISKGIRSSYPEANLPLSAREGACGSHVSGIKTAYLVLDSKLSAMPAEFKYLLLKDPETYGIYLAAAYNGGEKRSRALFAKTQSPTFRLQEVISNLFERWGIKKERQKLTVLRKETWIFIKKYFEVAKQTKD